jgi:hypothetical protein
VAQHSSGSEMRRASGVRSRQPGQSRGRFGLILGAGAVVIILAATLHVVVGNTDSIPVPSKSTLASLTLPRRIVAIAKSQVGYDTEPSSTYCNKFSAYWDVGTPDCPSGELAELRSGAPTSLPGSGGWLAYGSPTATTRKISTVPPSASTSGASPTASGTRRRADM